MFADSGQTAQIKPRRLSISAGFKPKKLSLCVAILSCSLAQPLWALGLGEIHSNSLLGEQLRARIAVIGEDQNLAAADVLASRISASEAERLGIDLMSDGRGIQVKAVETAKGVMLEVSSRQIINEPFLNFVVKLEWPSGSVYREYTLLLDLPVAPAQASASQASASQSRAPQSIVASGKTNVPQNFAPRASGVDSAQDYRVQIGDSLFTLAEQWLLRQGGAATGASLESVAKWLIENNPRAFAGGNANQLMAGALLTWPASAESVMAAGAARQLAQNSKQSAEFSSSTGSSSLTEASSLMTSEQSSKPIEARDGFTVGGEASFIHTPEYSQASLKLGGNLGDSLGEDPWQLVSVPRSSQAQASIEATHASLIASDAQSHSQTRSLVVKTQAVKTQAVKTQAVKPSAMRLRLGAAPNLANQRVSDLSQEGIEESLAAVVQSQLDVTHEVIDQLRRDNTDLRAQLTRLEQSEYLTTLTELVRLQGLQLAALQAQQQSQLASQTGETQDARATLNADSAALAGQTRVSETSQLSAQTPASGPVMASLFAEVHAAGLASYAPAAQGFSPIGGANSAANSSASARTPNSSPGLERWGFNVPASPTIGNSIGNSIGAATLLRWVPLFLFPLMLMGVYLLVTLRRQHRFEFAAARAADIDLSRDQPAHQVAGEVGDQERATSGFSLESLADLTLAQHTSDPAGFQASLSAFREQSGRDELVTDTNELLDRQTMAALLERSLREADVQSATRPDLSNNLFLSEVGVSLDAEATQVDEQLDQAFGSAMQQVFGENSLARSDSQREEHTGGPAVIQPAMLPTAVDAEYISDNVIPFERPQSGESQKGAGRDQKGSSNNNSDEALKRRIRDKVCHYHPPKPEEAGYIVQEGLESMDQYLNIEMIEAPEVSLDQSQDHPQKD
ncbi:MAG: type IV pilus assembly protein FimV [Cellvibrionaceae bacterium]